MPNPTLMAALARLAGAVSADATRTRATREQKPAPKRPLPGDLREAAMPTASIGPRTESGDQFQRTMQRATERAAGAEELQNSAINLLSMVPVSGAGARSLKGTPKQFELMDVNRFPNGNPEVYRVTERLREAAGVQGEGMPRVRAVDRARAQEMAGVYDRLPVNDPAAKRSYDALNAEVAQQLAAIRGAGYNIEFVDHDPYKTSAEMMADARDNRRLRVLKTNADSDHPYMTREQNDAFRAVHDFFAHAGEGHQFGPIGEENAYRVHASTLSKEAQRALASETRGQNSWVNFGPNAHLPVPERPFAQQKAALWPDEYLGDYHEMPGAKKRIPLDSAVTALRAPANGERFAVLTPENPGGQSLPEPENRARREQFEAEMRRKGRAFVPVVGRYSDPSSGQTLTESSYLFHGMPPFDAEALARQYWQNGVVTDRGYHDLASGLLYPSRGVRPATDVPYTELPNGSRFAADIDWEHAAPLLGLPPQHDLPRFTGPRIPAERVQEVYDLARAAMESPQWQQYRAQGEKLLGNRWWYDTRGTQQDALDALGDPFVARKAHNDLTNMMAASTAMSEPTNNLKRASWWRALYDQGQLDPEQLRSNVLLPPPEGFGHMAQRKTHQKAVADVAEFGGLDALSNPKPASFGGRGQQGTGNLGMNWQPATVDTRMSQILKEIEPRLTPAFDGGAPKNWAYGPVERAMQDIARRSAQRGDLTLLPGTSPTATEQERVWVGRYPEQGASTFRDVLDGLRSQSADLWGVDQSRANELLWRGQPLLLPLGAPLRGGR